MVDVGLAVEEDHRLADEVRAWAVATAGAVDQGFGLVVRFAAGIVSRSELGWSDDPGQWEELCTRRSAVAFFAELFAETPLAESLAVLDPDGLDRVMRGCAGHAFLAPGARPPGMPPRHWWWWLPGPPPVG